MKIYLKIFLLLLLSNVVWAQSNNSSKEAVEEVEINPKKVNSKTGLSKKAESAEKSYKSDERSAANTFVQLGDELATKGESEKAATQYQRAITIYEKYKMKAELAAAQRKLAKSQEDANNLPQAISNYTSAAMNDPNVYNRSLNNNDVKRVQTSNYEQRLDLAQQNESILKTNFKNIPEAKSEMSDVLTQIATTQAQKNNDKEAVKTLSKAISLDKQSNLATEKAVAEISKSLVKDNKIDEAIALQIQLLHAADSAGDLSLSLKLKKQIADLYFRNEMPSDAEQYLLSAYHSAKKRNLTKESKNALLSLDSFYKATGQSQKAQELSHTFLKDLDQLLAMDSSLIDMKTFESTEKRIAQLENEKALQANVIKQTKRSNVLLIIIAGVIFASLLFLGKAYFTITRRNKQIRLQSLRKDMNPHFVFNSLNSVNQFIAENNELKANKYLNAYSTLMRTIMEHSGKDFVPLAVELDHLEKYLSLEHQRFQDKFEYQILVDENIDRYHVAMPNMIVQPFLENAVWHGLRYKEDKGILKLLIQKMSNTLQIIVEDNGIGIAKSQQLKTVNQKQHNSMGMANTKERIELLNKLYKVNITFEVQELANSGGTKVIINLPTKAIQDEN